MLLMLSTTAELTGAAKKMTEADIRSTVKLGNTLTERPDVLAAADPSMFINGVCAAPGNGVPASTSASDGDGAAVAAAPAGTPVGTPDPHGSAPGVSGGSNDGTGDHGGEPSHDIVYDSPCWVQAHLSLLGVTAADGTALTSMKSHLLLKRCSGALEIKHYPTLIGPLFIEALYMLDPHSFFYSHVVSSKLQALPVPLALCVYGHHAAFEFA